MKYVDFALAVSMFLFFFAMVLILSTNYFSNISGLTKTSEFRSMAEGLFKLLFESKGIPEDWEENPDLNPVQLGLIEDIYRIPVLVKETSGYNRTNELVSVNIVFDEDCEDKAWNNSVRVFDVSGNEIPFKLSKESFCSNQFLKQAKVVWETNLTANQNKKFYVYYSSDDTIYAPNYTDTFSTVGYWHFDEGSGNMTYDSSANENDGKLYNGTQWNSDEPTWTTGRFENALNFDGENDFINVSGSTNLDITDALSLEAWINTRSVSPTDVNLIVDKQDNTFSGYRLSIELVSANARLEFGTYNGTGYDELNSINNLNLDTWYYVVGTWDGTTKRVFINGVEDNSVIWKGPIISNNLDVLIGADESFVTGYYFNGTIDEVRIWNRALSPEEINASYISGPTPVKSFPEENLNTLSPSKLNALKNVSYEDILKTLGDYKFRIEIGESE